MAQHSLVYLGEVIGCVGNLVELQAKGADVLNDVLHILVLLLWSRAPQGFTPRLSSDVTSTTRIGTHMATPLCSPQVPFRIAMNGIWKLQNRFPRPSTT